MVRPEVSGSVTSFRMSHEIVPVLSPIMSRHIVPVKKRLPGWMAKLPHARRNRCLETSFLHAEQMEKPAPKIIIETMLATGMTQAEAAEHFGVTPRWIRTLQK